VCENQQPCPKSHAQKSHDSGGEAVPACSTKSCITVLHRQKAVFLPILYFKEVFRVAVIILNVYPFAWLISFEAFEVCQP
jgi:hypothetical protein